jgi:acyl carrier protein
MTQAVLRKVRELAARVAGRDIAGLMPDTNLYVDLGLDSASALELVVALEDTFDIQISSQDADELETLADIASMVRRVIGERRR